MEDSAVYPAIVTAKKNKYQDQARLAGLSYISYGWEHDNTSRISQPYHTQTPTNASVRHPHVSHSVHFHPLT